MVLNNDQIPTFQIMTVVLDSGQQSVCIIINMKTIITQEILNQLTFHIHAQHLYNHQIQIEKDIDIKDMFITNDDLSTKNDSGHYIVLEFDPIPTLYWDEYHFTNCPMTLNYQITMLNHFYNQSLKLKYNGLINKIVDQFMKKTSQEGLNYRMYIPQFDNHKHPLIIWLHGAGEGGTNNETQITGNRGAVAFVEYQDIFDYPYVIAPQAPDFWMDELILGDCILKGHDYTKEVVSLIQEVIHGYDNIDSSRIYIGGCSMGGYQTWKTIIAEPGLFAGAFPICPAYCPTQEELKTLVDLPIWMTHASLDDTISVENSRKAYKTLKSLGGKVIYSEYKDVHYNGINYANHSSWVYVLNNDPVNENGEHIFQWLSHQKLE